MITEYKTIIAPGEGVFKDKGSSFLGFAFGVKDETEVKRYLQEIKKAHHKCNHHCYAFRMKPDGSHYRSNDDREPSGSAGKPILGQLLSHNLTDALIIVARYFGGSLLGVPGLIHAYRAAAADAIAHATVAVMSVNVRMTLSFPYHFLNEIMILLKSEKHKITSQVTGETVILEVELPVAVAERLTLKMKNTAFAAELILDQKML